MKACTNIETEIFVVDNNSSDGSRDFFTGRFPSVRFFWNHSNAGFAKANNEALRHATGQRILFLNPDTIVPEDCFEKCLDFFNDQKFTGALGVKMIDGSGNFLPESKRGFPSFFTSFCKMTGLTGLLPHSKIFARYYLGHLPPTESNEVDVLSGAFMMVDKKVLEINGGFDEDYFMYAEDIDLSYRIQKAGYSNHYFAGTAIIHFKGESVTKKSPEYIRNFYGTMVLFVQKHYSGLSRILYVRALKILITLKNIFSAKGTAARTERYNGKTFVVGKEADLRVLPLNFTPVQYIDHSSAATEDSALVFMEPFLTFKEIINQMQQNRNRYRFFIHTKGTRSIVGSVDKNQPGSAIEL